MGLPVGIYNGLKRAGINYKDEIDKMSDDDILNKVLNVGKNRLNELREIFANYKEDDVDIDSRKTLIGNLDFSIRTYNLLKSAGIKYKEEIEVMNDSDILKIVKNDIKILFEIRRKVPKDNNKI